MQGSMASSRAVMLTGSGQRDGRFGTAIAALGDINLDHYNGAESVCLAYLYKEHLNRRDVKHKNVGLHRYTIIVEQSAV